MAQLSDDCFAHGGRLMTTAEALDHLTGRVSRVTADETVPLIEALGRILSEDLVAPADVPPHDNSAVDGYAVHFDDLDTAAETRLPVRGRAAAGHPLEGPAARGAAVRIFTGAPMPEGPDTVMMQEDCRLENDEVVIAPGIRRGANPRARGEDIRVGRRVLAAGQRLCVSPWSRPATSCASQARPSRRAVSTIPTGSRLPPYCRAWAAGSPTSASSRTTRTPSAAPWKTRRAATT